MPMPIKMYVLVFRLLRSICPICVSGGKDRDFEQHTRRLSKFNLLFQNDLIPVRNQQQIAACRKIRPGGNVWGNQFVEKILAHTNWYVYICIMQADTRQRILEKNFEAMHEHGYQGMRADKVVKELGITKGAFYHYFKGKQALGYAIVDEIMAPMYLRSWTSLSGMSGDPIPHIIQVLESMLGVFSEERIKLGCPLNNLMQEMSPLDDGFRYRLQRIIEGMRGGVSAALKRGQAEGFVRTDIDPEAAATFIIAALEGAFGMGKVLQSLHAYEQSVRQLMLYVHSLSK